MGHLKVGFGSRILFLSQCEHLLFDKKRSLARRALQFPQQPLSKILYSKLCRINVTSNIRGLERFTRTTTVGFQLEPHVRLKAVINACKTSSDTTDLHLIY